MQGDSIHAGMFNWSRPPGIKYQPDGTQKLENNKVHKKI